jgi:protein-export membrane protein SecD
MLYFSRLKIALILGACFLGALLCVPNLLPAPAAWLPWRQVHLGLDLRGGSYLLMQVDMNAVVKERLDGLIDSARQTLRTGADGKPIFAQNLVAEPAEDRVTLRIRDAEQLQAALSALRTALGAPDPATGLVEVDVAGFGDNQISLTLSRVALTERARTAVQQSIEIVRRRIDETGVLDPVINQQGADRIVVQLPGISDPERIKGLLGTTARMTFRLLDEQANTGQTVPPPGDEFLPMQDQPTNKLAIRRRVEVDGADLTDARAGQNQQTGQWVVNFAFNSVGGRRFADVTRQNVGHRFAIVLDNRVISAPVIREAITGGRGEISGSFDARSATDLSLLLRAGALPAPLNVVEERSVGPELGADSIRAGALSLLVGFVLVIGFMGVFYGLFGWFANVALLFNLILMLAILSLLEATLTLPGMAGILLTLGMAVDANILINERIREETRNGRPPVAAMENGFRRAYSTIIDSNVTALLAHVMLFVFGTGPVRGFAVTITVGIITTLFTATILARLLMVRWYARTRPTMLPV